MTQYKLLALRRALERGHADHGWLNSYHTFSFAGYYDDRYNGFGPLRVLNEDVVTPNEGFGRHPHREYEIWSYIVSGELEHKDSLGNVEILPRGFVQMTSTGTGISHSEYNRNRSKKVHFLQLWAKPWRNGLTPSYQTRKFTDEDKLNKLCSIIVPNRPDVIKEKLVTINQDLYFYASLLENEKKVEHTLKEGRGAYLHIVESDDAETKQQASLSLKIQRNKDGVVEEVHNLKSGDGVFLAPSGESTVTLTGSTHFNPIELVLIDVNL